MKIFEKRNIPNLLSVIRLLMIPCFVWLFFAEFPHHRVWALGVFIAAGLTDVVDGYLARTNGWVTDLGKIIDPLADKLMQATAFVCIAVKTRIGIFLAAFIFVKDFLMMIGGIVLAKKGAKDLVVSKWYGKLATCVLAVTLGTLILFYEKQTLSLVMAGISAAAMSFALLMYLICVFMRFIGKSESGISETETRQ